MSPLRKRAVGRLKWLHKGADGLPPSKKLRKSDFLTGTLYLPCYTALVDREDGSGALLRLLPGMKGKVLRRSRS
ncbi:hypothetical protein HMPREF1986_00693 [Oribacterium sp. oral taxon 078 str. F0263]|nr:hypothetical protein HMPREF1986_00693 [Oribacterium sp. oral taxon 078 str. F0263]